MKKISEWFYSGTALDVWRRLFNFNLAMISISFLLYYFQDDKSHLIMAGVWCVLALIGLSIRKVLDDHPSS